MLDEVRYTYGFAFDDKRLIWERLHAYPHNRRCVLFERNAASIDFGSTVSQRTRVQVIEDLLTDDTLFLAVAARLKLDQYKPVTDWFLRSLQFVWASHFWPRDEELALFIEKSESDRARLLELVHACRRRS